MSRYLQLRGTTYYLRVPVPRDLQSIVGVREIRKSLKTGDKRLAARRADVLVGKIRTRFDELQQQQLEDELESLLSLTNTCPAAEDKNDVVNNSSSHPSVKKSGDPADSVDFPGSSVKNPGPPADPVPTVVPSDAPSPDVVTPAVPAVVPNDGPDFVALFAQYIRELQRGGLDNPKTIDHYHESWRLYLEVMSAFDDKGSLCTKSAGRFKDALLKLPSNRTKRPKYRDFSLGELLEMDVPADDLMRPNTINNHLNRLSGFANWLVKHEHLARNPFSGLKVKTSNKRDARHPFSRAQIRALFSDDIFAGFRFRTTWQYWVPLIGLHTGARLAEICQLRKQDVVQIKGIWCFMIQDVDSETRTKTAAGVRIVPIHSKLIDLGFLRYVEALGPGKLFNLERTASGEFKAATKYFANLRRRCGVGKTDGKLCFHSFRHTLIDELKPHEPNLVRVMELVGHETGGITTDTYGGRIQPKELAETLERLDFSEELELVAPWP